MIENLNNRMVCRKQGTDGACEKEVALPRLLPHAKVPVDGIDVRRVNAVCSSYAVNRRKPWSSDAKTQPVEP